MDETVMNITMDELRKLWETDCKVAVPADLAEIAVHYLGDLDKLKSYDQS